MKEIISDNWNKEERKKIKKAYKDYKKKRSKKNKRFEKEKADYCVYLDSTIPFKPDQQMFFRMKSFFEIHENGVFLEKLRKLEYKKFLKTPYWKIISFYVRWLARFKCRLCGNEGDLEVHHKRYDSRGKEVFFWRQDLICVCLDCHDQIHKIWF